MTKRIIQRPSRADHVHGKEGGKGRVKTATGHVEKKRIKKTIGIGCYFDEVTFEALKEYSQETQKSMSWIMRDATIDFLINEGYIIETVNPVRGKAR